MELNAAGQVFIALIGYKLIDLGTAYFFKKATKEDYVTKSDCSNCSKQGDAAVEKLADDISVMKGILLVIAVKSNIPPEDLKELTQ